MLSEDASRSCGFWNKIDGNDVSTSCSEYKVATGNDDDTVVEEPV